MPPASVLRAHIEAFLAERVPHALDFRPALIPEMVPTGIAAVDQLTAGGVPRGCLTEICGTASSGRTTLVISLLAQVTDRGEAAALIDVTDAFDPEFAATAGVRLESLLWVRCGGGSNREAKHKWGVEARIEQALKIADWLLQAGGFSVIALDMAGVPPRWARRIPLASWFRFRRAVENTATAFVLIEQQPYAKTCASLVLNMTAAEVNWSAMQLGELPPAQNSTTLLKGITFNAELIRSRIGAAEARRPMATAFTAEPAWNIRNVS
jgi:recombination protein RecA